MPRFFFHVYDDDVARDEEGLELRDREAARIAAIAGLRALAAEQVIRGRLHLDHRIEVEDESGERVLALRFAEAIVIEQ